MRVPFFDLSRQTARLRGEIQRALMEVIDSQQFVLGPAVGRLEAEVAATLGVRNAIGVASGSDALLLSLMAAGVQPGVEVIVPAFSFFATASAALRLGGRLVFADIDPATFQIDPGKVSRKITGATRALVATHLYGDCADLTTLHKLASDHGFPLIEDAAQAFGARHHRRYAGTVGACGCFSFYPTKNLGGFGDGGMVVTNDEETAARIRRLANHGIRDRYTHEAPGINSRLDSLQAAVLSVKLGHVGEWNQRRREIAGLYTEGLAGLAATPVPSLENECVFHQFVIRTGDRDALREHLSNCGVGTEVYYPVPLHLQPGLAPYCGKPGDFPEAESVAGSCLALPVFPELTDEEVAYVIGSIRQFVTRERAS